MYKMATSLLLLSTLVLSCTKADHNIQSPSQIDTAVMYTMPEESTLHEGTWLQWPHEYQYGKTYRNRLDKTWIDMTKALILNEKVHIIVYNQDEQQRVIKLLEQAQVKLDHIDFTIQPTDDVWVRDNGPIYVKNKDGKILIEDWGFNGWGEKATYINCNKIPSEIALKQNIEKVDLNKTMINEGGSIEIDGNGTLLACKSSILNDNRNPGLTQKEAENIFTKYLGVQNFIWLDGKAGLDITDMHIDGFARFADSSTIVSMHEEDLLYWQVPTSDIKTLKNAVNQHALAYKFVEIPLTKNEVTTTYGKNVGKASYINYYIANQVVLVPNYNDPNDKIANEILQKLYPERKIIGIDCRNLFANGGMVHCVTQQQPK